MGVNLRKNNMTTTPNISSYLVYLFRWNPIDNVYEKKDDCTMYLDLNTGDFEVVSLPSRQNTVKHAGKNKSLRKYIGVNIINDNFTIISRQRHHIASLHNLSSPTYAKDLTIDYEMRYETHRFGISFDSRSSASEANFYSEFMKLRSKYKFTERYQSGNIMIEGTKTASGYNGFCIEYHDKEESPIKYMGEYEDGKYDGEGEFFSIDGNIRISCKNICSGKPNGTGRLVIGRNRVTKIIDMKNYTDDKSTDPNYTNTIYAKIEPMYDELMELLNFESLSLDDRTIYLFREIQKLKSSTKSEPVGQKSFFNIF